MSVTSEKKITKSRKKKKNYYRIKQSLIIKIKVKR